MRDGVTGRLSNAEFGLRNAEWEKTDGETPKWDFGMPLPVRNRCIVEGYKEIEICTPMEVIESD
jgi:hypothetical protein